MVFFKWMFWTLFFACLLGGHPWEFPENGKYLFQKEGESLPQYSHYSKN